MVALSGPAAGAANSSDIAGTPAPAPAPALGAKTSAAPGGATAVGPSASNEPDSPVSWKGLAPSPSPNSERVEIFTQSASPSRQI